jgi:TrmH family RNA methyltransferase
VIKSLKNEKVKLARSLLTRKGRWKHRLFLVEGGRIIREAVGAGFKPVFVFYSEDFAPKEVLPLEEASCYQVPEAIIKAISSTVTPQGIVAVFPFPELPLPEDWELAVVLDGVQNPENLGAVMRTAAAAGAAFLATTPGSADPFNPKAVRAAMGAHFHIPLKPNAPWEELRSLLQGKQILLADPQGPVPYFAVDWTAPSVLVIGGEARGATGEARQLAHQIVSIPMARPIESLNAAVAAGIILYEAFRQRLLSRPC